MLLHTPPNETKIDRLYAVMSVDAEGRTGICAQVLPGLGSTPMVTGKREIARKMVELAKKMPADPGKRLGLFVFKLEEELSMDEILF